MNNLFKALAPLFAQMPQFGKKQAIGVAKKTSSEDKGTKSRKKTQKGATHRPGHHFLGRQILSMTPAQYRHGHFGNREKAVYEKLRLEKRKWISE